MLLVVMTTWVLWMALTPQPRGPALPWDKANHVGAFAALSFVAYFASRDRPRATLGLCMGLVLLGALIEWGQMYVPGRYAEALDLLADTVGIAIGLSIALPLARLLDRRRRRRLPGEQPPAPR